MNVSYRPGNNRQTTGYVEEGWSLVVEATPQLSPLLEYQEKLRSCRKSHYLLAIETFVGQMMVGFSLSATVTEKEQVWVLHTLVAVKVYSSRSDVERSSTACTASASCVCSTEAIAESG
jgi:hypothetical protein